VQTPGFSVSLPSLPCQYWHKPRMSLSQMAGDQISSNKHKCSQEPPTQGSKFPYQPDTSQMPKWFRRVPYSPAELPHEEGKGRPEVPDGENSLCLSASAENGNRQLRAARVGNSKTKPWVKSSSSRCTQTAPLFRPSRDSGSHVNGTCSPG
jgi:hypothetical protein